MMCCVLSGMMALCAVCQQPIHAIALHQVAGDDEHAGTGWLGVRIEVPEESLRHHLRLDDTGLVVVNLVEDGPAARNGLQRFDVLIAVDGQRIANDFESFATLVRQYEPGRSVAVDIIRHAERKTVEIELGARPEALELSWSYELPAEPVYSNDLAVTGKVLLRGHDGEWIFEDIGEVELSELDVFLPESNKKTIEWYTADGQLRKRSTVKLNDMCFEMEEIEGGQICIRRLAEGDRQESIYPNVEALRESDHEAYEIYVQMQGDHEWGGTSLDEQVRQERLAELKAAFGRGLREADELRRQAQKEYAAANDRVAAARLKLEQLGGVSPGVTEQPEATYAFTDEEGGGVTVVIRKGDTELTRKYASQDKLREENPRLHERYLALRPSE